MRLNISFEIIDDKTNKGLRLRKVQEPSGKKKVFLESFDENGTYSRKRLKEADLSDIIYILDTGELPQRFKRNVERG